MGKLIFTAITAMTLSVGVAEAAVPTTAHFNATGKEFYEACDTGLSNIPPPTACKAVVADIAYQLTVNGFMCGPNDISDPRLLILAQNWIRSYAANARGPAGYMITTAFMDTFPCHGVAAQPPTFKTQPLTLEQLLQFLTIMKDLWVLLS